MLASRQHAPLAVTGLTSPELSLPILDPGRVGLVVWVPFGTVVLPLAVMTTSLDHLSRVHSRGSEMKMVGSDAWRVVARMENVTLERPVSQVVGHPVCKNLAARTIANILPAKGELSVPGREARPCPLPASRPGSSQPPEPLTNCLWRNQSRR